MYTSESKAEEDVLAERRRQVHELGWTTKHDDEENRDHQLAEAAVVYADGATLHDQARKYLASRGHPAAPFKPASWVDKWPSSWDLSWYKPTTRRRDLVKAAALLIAEIERLDREEINSSKEVK